ncbi:MAG: hypothetical protein LBR80_13275 [Deltaproteobacteria bacterium]|jgi:hypothetical protein|nr:hypothetical protein [Deltaproteobacteria bacterium]
MPASPIRSIPIPLLVAFAAIPVAVAALAAAPALAQSEPRRPFLHDEYMLDSGYRAAYGIYSELAGMARQAGWERLDGRALRGIRFPAPEAGREEWERAMKLASLRLGRSIPPEQMGAPGNAMKFLRLYMMERQSGSPLFGFMHVVAVGEGPEYGVHISVYRAAFRGYPPGICEFEGIGGIPREGVMGIVSAEGKGAVMIASSEGVLAIAEAEPVPCSPGTGMTGRTFRLF